MEPAFINLKQENPESTTWYIHNPYAPSVSPRQQRRATKRSVSFTSNCSSERPFPSMEPNSIPLDMKTEWHDPYDGFPAHFPVNQQGPMDTFEAPYHYHHETQPHWKQEFQETEAPMEGNAKDSYDLLPHVEEFAQQQQQQQQNSQAMGHYMETHTKMESFPPEEVADFKHVVYNLLVEYHNDPSGVHLVEPCTLVEHGRGRQGFRFNESCNPEKRLPELYVQHLKNAQLELENQNSPLIQDLYKFYMRSCVELLSKYFEKLDKYTYLYEDADNPLFVPNGNLLDAEVRIKNMKTRTRKKKASNKKEVSTQSIKVVVPPKPVQQLSSTVPSVPVPISRALHGRKKPAFFTADFIGKHNLE